MNILKRIFAFFLALVLVAENLPLSAGALDAVQDGEHAQEIVHQETETTEPDVTISSIQQETESSLEEVSSPTSPETQTAPTEAVDTMDQETQPAVNETVPQPIEEKESIEAGMVPQTDPTENASENGVEVETFQYINPIYEEVLTAESLLSTPDQVTALSNVVHTSKESATVDLRQQMTQRHTTVVLNLHIPQEQYVGQFVYDLMDQAMAHTGVPKEGDYLRYQYGGWESSTSRTDTGDGYYDLTITYTVTYYTTAEQEAWMDTRIPEVLAELNLSGKTDYQKIRAIYDYICENVVYDHDHMDWPEYKLQFTAYAALSQGVAVCQGFANLLYRMLLEAGIDSRIITGISENEGHAWNIAGLDGYYYNLDATWDRGGSNVHRYFLCTEQDFPDHVRDAEFTTAAFHAAYPMAQSSYVINVQASGTLSNGMKWVLDGDTGMLTVTGKGAMPNFTNRNAPWQNYVDSIRGVTISEGITSVGSYAFCFHTKVATISLPSTLLHIRQYAFNNCRALQYVTLPEGLKTLEFCAFSECAGLKEVTVPGSVTTFGSNIFSNCKGLKKATICEGITKLPDSMFGNCLALSQVSLPSTLTELEDTVFINCDSFTSFTIPARLTKVGQSNFTRCNGLQNFYVEEGNPLFTAIDGVLYSKDKKTLITFPCGRSGTYTIPDGTTTIGDGAFYEAYNLTKINIPDSVTYIDEYAFIYCDGLTSMTVGKNVTFVGDHAFGFCKYLRTVIFENPDTVIDSSCFSNCKRLTTLTLPSRLKRIESSTFWNCDSLTNVTIPNTVTYIGSGAFQSLDKVTSHDVPASVSKIEHVSFYDNPTLEDITFRGNLSYVDWKTFADCPKLRFFRVVGTLSGFYSSAFENTNNITAIYLDHPNSADDITGSTSLGGMARSAKSIAVAEGSAVSNYIANKYPITSRIVYDGGAFTLYSDHTCSWSLIDFYDQTSVYQCTICCARKFTHWNHVYTASVVAPSCEAEGYTLHKCTCGEQYKDNFVPALGHKFENDFCTVCGLYDLYDYGYDPVYWELGYSGTLRIFQYGDMMDFAMDSAPWYHYRDRITKVEFYDWPTSIGAYAFQDCVNLTTIDIPEAITDIGEGAFYNCTSLSELKFTADAPIIQENAFYGMTAEVWYPAGRNNWEEVVQQNYGGNITWKPYCIDGHSIVTDAAVAPTCTTSGLTEGSHCTGCGLVVVAQEKVPALGHDWDEGIITKEATEDETGMRLYTCNRCKENREEVVPKLEHVHRYETTVNPPTCTEDGFTFYVCPCGDSYMDDFTPATGHNYVTTVTLPTCTEDGFTDVTCSYCGDGGITETVTALGHSWDAGIVTKEPTEEQTGIRLYTCIRCAEIREEVIPKLEHVHKYSAVVTKPTCTEGGYTTYTCTCGDSYTNNETVALGHSYNGWTLAKLPTLIEGGQEKRTCSICAQEEVRSISCPNSLDDIAWGSLTYRDIFITNNIVYVDGFNTKSFYPFVQNTGTNTITGDACYSGPYSLAAFGSPSQQLASPETIKAAGEYFLASKVWCIRYDKGTLGVCLGSNSVGLQKVTDGFVTASGIVSATTSNKAFLGSFHSADLDGYVDDPVAVNLSLFEELPTEEQLTQLYDNYADLEKAREREEVLYSEEEMLDAFVRYMNSKAISIGMTDSAFRDPVGIDNLSTAENLLRLMVYADTYPELENVWNKTAHTVTVGGENAREQEVVSTVIKPELEDYYHILGGKTGTLSAYNARNLAVILEIPDSGDKLAVVVMYADGTDTEADNRYEAARQAADAALTKYRDPNVDTSAVTVCCQSAIACLIPAEGADLENLTILYEKKADIQKVPASITKVLTAICALDILDTLDSLFTYSEFDTGIGSFYAKDFTPGDRMSYQDALYAMLLPSSNVTARAVARTVGKLILEQDIHIHEYQTSTTTPTCTKEGYTVYTCTDCGFVYKDFQQAALGHSYEGTVSAPTCTEAGYTTQTCTICGDSYVDSKVPSLGHTEVIDKAVAPTCTETGLTEGRHCSVCDTVLVKQEVVPAKGHTEVIDKSAAPTCNETGLTEGKHCSVCDTILVKQEVIPAKGHTEVIDKAVAPTCTETGLTEGKHCSVCDTVLVKQETVPAKGHSWNNGVITIQPTEEKEGLKTFTCTVCGETKTEVIPTLDHAHSYDAVVTKPTCTEEGFTTHTCRCGDSYVDTKIPALGHTEVIDKAVSATCTESGLTEGKHCSVCDTILVKQEVIPVKGHTEVIDQAVAPTCTETGLTEGRHCSVCNTVLVKQETVRAKGHSWNNGVITIQPTEEKEGLKTFTCTACGEIRTEIIPTLDHVHSYDAVATKPTCTEEGYTTHTCRCGDSYVDTKIPALGHTEVIDKAVPATCTETGLTAGKHCSVCEIVLVEQEQVPAKGHSWNNGVITIQPTEEKEGLKTFTCTACGETKTEVIPTLDHVHSYDSVVTKPTCTEEGFTTHTCRCGDSYVDTKVPALGHKEVIDKAVAATCTETGLTEGKHCSVCDVVLVEQKVVPAKGHAEVIDKAVAPTCTEMGLTEGKHCSVCGTVLVKQEILPAKGHTEVIDKAVAPTCTETGLTEGKHCSICDTILIKQNVLSAKGHLEVVDKAAAPTCTETGLTEGKHCSICDTILVKQNVIPAKGHTEVTDKAVVPTCTETGLTEGSHCSVCGMTLVKQEMIPAHGHTEVTVNAVAATCTEPGLTEGKYCAVCRTVLVKQESIPAKGHTEVIDKAVSSTCTETGLTEGRHCSVCNTVLVKQEIIPAKGHRWNAGIITVQPTEEAEGLKIFTCTTCDESKEQILPTLDHVHKYEAVVTAPTCTEEGYTTHTCRCGDSYVDTHIPALGHSEVTDQAVAATCTQTGLTEGRHCSVCGMILIHQQVVPARGHTEVVKKAVAATCTETGLTEGKYCSVCDTILEKQEIIPAKGHREVTDRAKAPTCTQTGLTEGSHCSVCEIVLVKQETIPAKGHIWNQGVVTVPPTEESEGQRVYTCTACGETRTEVIPTLDHVHSYDVVVTKPTCTEEGYTTHTCRCGDSYVDSRVPALGHTEVIDKAVAATCTEAGMTEGKHCAVCGTILVKQESVPAQGHLWDEGVVQREPTAEEEGIRLFTCQRCGQTRTEEISKVEQQKHLVRISGKDRVDTAIKTAELLRSTLGVEKFETIILASGAEFADALAGSYLAAVKQAPVLLSKGGNNKNLAYIQQTLAENGVVYILGGTAAVSESMEALLVQNGINCERIKGSGRLETNIEILKKAGITGNEVLVATGWEFADSLSASATGKPILLVNNKTGHLTKVQKEYLETLRGKQFTIIGGSGAVSEQIAQELAAYGTVDRISGKTREVTSIKVAERYFENKDTVFLAYSRNFPDGLCGGPLAYTMGAPLLLINQGKENWAAEFVAENKTNTGYIMGGSAVISDASARAVFALDQSYPIQ